MKGIIFDIKQMSVFDGPGIRTTVFLKGCPLRCQWCHNPEGLSLKPEIMFSGNGCISCGRCQKECPSPRECVVCGRCALVCPLGLRRICGRAYAVEELAKKLLKDAEYLKQNAGGYTLSGGEPCMQAGFVKELLKALNGSHRAIETCGYCSQEDFAQILQNLDYVIMDIKIADPEQHKHYTGRDNTIILRNLEQLMASGVPHIIRVPLIPGITDTEDNQRRIVGLLKGDVYLHHVELMPYHMAAGAKYKMVNREYNPQFNPEQALTPMPEIFIKEGIVCQMI